MLAQLRVPSGRRLGLCGSADGGAVSSGVATISQDDASGEALSGTADWSQLSPVASVGPAGVSQEEVLPTMATVDVSAARS